MKPLLSTLFFLILAFFLPLLGKLELLLSPVILFSATIICILLLSQPQVNKGDAQRDKKTDKGTTFLIMITSLIGHILSVLEWAYFPQIHLPLLVIIGVGLMVIGIAFRLIAIRSLKNAFSSTIQIKEGQRLYSKGLYAKFRHPSYTGAWVFFIGNALIFQSFMGILILGIGMFIVYMRRIEVEEELLKNEFGDEYTEYAKTSWKFLPFW